MKNKNKYLHCIFAISELRVYILRLFIYLFRVKITPEDPRWVGAWWIGFLIASILFLMAAIPISTYGAELPSMYICSRPTMYLLHENIPIQIYYKFCHQTMKIYR